jgi:hypothetical protein
MNFLQTFSRVFSALLRQNYVFIHVALKIISLKRQFFIIFVLNVFLVRNVYITIDHS